MATKKFPSELASRGTVKTTDKLIIHNIDTGATEYTTVAALFTALLNGNIRQGWDNYEHSFYYDADFNMGIKATVADRKLTIFSSTTDSGGDIEINWPGSKKGKLIITTMVEYADNAAALTAGLTAGSFYRTGDLLKIVH